MRFGQRLGEGERASAPAAAARGSRPSSLAASSSPTRATPATTRAGAEVQQHAGQARAPRPRDARWPGRARTRTARRGRGAGGLVELVREQRAVGEPDARRTAGSRSGAPRARRRAPARAPASAAVDGGRGRRRRPIGAAAAGPGPRHRARLVAAAAEIGAGDRDDPRAAWRRGPPVRGQPRRRRRRDHHRHRRAATAAGPTAAGRAPRRHDHQPSGRPRAGRAAPGRARRASGVERRPDGRRAAAPGSRGWASTSRSARTRRTCSSIASARPSVDQPQPARRTTTTACSAPAGPRERHERGAVEHGAARLVERRRPRRHHARRRPGSSRRAAIARLELAAAAPAAARRAAGSCSTARSDSTVCRSSPSSSAATGSSGGRTAGNRLVTARARSAASSTSSGRPVPSASGEIELGEAAAVHGRGRRAGRCCRSWPGRRRGRSAPCRARRRGCSAVAARRRRGGRGRSGACRRAVIGSAWRAARADAASGGRGRASSWPADRCASAASSAAVRAGSRDAVALELLAQPQRGPVEPPAGSTGREIALQQHAARRCAASGRCRGGGTGRGRASRSRRAACDVAGDQRAPGPLEFGLAEILRRAGRARKIAAARGERVVGLADQAGLGEHPRAVEQRDAARQVVGRASSAASICAQRARAGRRAGTRGSRGCAAALNASARPCRCAGVLHRAAPANGRARRPARRDTSAALPALQQDGELVVGVGVVEQRLGGGEARASASANRPARIAITPRWLCTRTSSAGSSSRSAARGASSSDAQPGARRRQLGRVQRDADRGSRAQHAPVGRTVGRRPSSARSQQRAAPGAGGR